MTPEFSDEARGTPADWNRNNILWCRRNKQQFEQEIESARQDQPVVNIATIERFLSKRKDAEGRPVRARLGAPQAQADGWVRLRWIACTDDDILKLEQNGWGVAWHGSKLEALYSICFHGEVFESCKPGDRWLKNAPGFYCHQQKTAHLAKGYATFAPLCKDGVYWANMWEVLVDRSQSVPTGRKKENQWVQKAKGVKLVALWVRGRSLLNMRVGHYVAREWDPNLECNPNAPRANSRIQDREHTPETAPAGRGVLRSGPRTGGGDDQAPLQASPAQPQWRPVTTPLRPKSNQLEDIRSWIRDLNRERLACAKAAAMPAGLPSDEPERAKRRARLLQEAWPRIGRQESRGAAKAKAKTAATSSGVSSSKGVA